MVLQIRNDEELIISLPLIEYDNQTRNFLLKNDDENISILVPYNLIKNDEFNPEEFIVYLVHHNSLPEGHIFELWEKSIDRRVGWIFPLQALQSDNHSYSENVHFLKLAYVAFCKLINGDILTKDPNNLIKIPKELPSLNLDDFYNPESVIVILHKPELERIDNFDISNYTPSLFRYGYTLTLNCTKTVHPLLKKEFFREGQEGRLRERINLRPMSEHLRGEAFIKILFEEKLAKEEHPLVRFYLLYQVIELLISRVFKFEFNKLLNSTNPDEVNLFDFREVISDISSEKRRINILLTNYSKANSNELKQLCSNFLGLVEEERQKNSLGDIIYKVRSFLVHDYRKITPNQQNTLIDINYYFERFILLILIDFSIA